jgi:type II secretory pathway pseudopilin PulG
MSTRKKKTNFVQRLLKPIWQSFDAVTKAIANRLLRSLLVLKRQSSLSQTGFVLPTIVMVILVVILLTTAIMIRSFDRSKNASNVRVDQAVLKAATPALDRARAKIDKLFSLEETELQGNTPPEANIASILEQERYQLGDETQIQLTGDFGGQTPADPKAKTLQSAWKFPVDTDNNGKFDTFTLYGIYFRNPRTANSNENNRPRGTTEARALPQNDGQGDRCANGSAGGVEGWDLVGGQLKKAFFTYVANVPITETTGLDNKYEKYKGNKGFSALEMQLDQARIALDNNAIWYNDDLAISLIPSLRLNGRVHTNSNLLVENDNSNPIKFLQVSSTESCFYNPANAKIIVGGNVAAGDIGRSDSGSNAITVDLYKGKRNPPDTTPVINTNNKTTRNTPSEVAANSDAFTQRLDLLVQGAINLHDQVNAAAAGVPTVASVEAMVGRYPQDVIDEFNKKYDPKNPGSGLNALTQSLETYFANRIRRVSFAEVPITDPPSPKAGITLGGTELSPVPGDAGFVFSAGGEIKPPAAWMTIDGNNTGLTLNITGSTMQMSATNPGTGAASLTRIEQEIGDRLQVGNNLPSRWLKPDGTFAKEAETQDIAGVNWNNGGQRKRTGLAEQLDDLGDTSRDGYWETAAAKVPPLDVEDLAGGLRVVTGAGIYVDGIPGASGTGRRMSAATAKIGDRSFLPEPTLDSYFASAKDPATGALDATKKAALEANLPPNYKVVWPDSMPMYQWIDRNNPRTPKPFDAPGIPEQLKGDLQMRATVVYHYKSGDDPIACISSYYDPTDPYTASDSVSNNGKSYAPPAAGDRIDSLTLRRQSQMVFPDGRWVNKPLYDALVTLRRGGAAALSLADKASIDAANCAFSILKNPGAAIPSPVVPDNAIRERTFLDARQLKAVHKVGTEALDPAASPAIVPAATLVADLNNPDHLKMASREALVDDTTTPQYTLPLEQRQPLEIRVTEIDLDALRKTAFGSDDFLLPNNGIIYASRDDALPDLTATQEPANQRPIEIRDKKNKPSKTAATDFKLDPTRRPNGIRLINGSNLERSSTYKAAEKGLILASDLPVYIKGDFNLHQASGGGGTLEEFTQKVDTNNFYSRSTPDDNFACRKGSPTNCGSTGDQWRTARILSDAITLLSDNFRDGYRYEGDYDLRNNAGNLAVEPYLDNGFWMNSFATTAKWYGTNGLPRPDFSDDVAGTVTKTGSSYVMNGVTPIQRRAQFPAYKMEICRKLPASQCGPQDWRGGSLSTSNEARLAGSTAAPATPPVLNAADKYASEHYARRVAFERDTFGQLALDTDPVNPAKVTAKPLRPVGGGSISYVAGATPPAPPQSNALWFATTSDPSNPSAGPNFGAAGLLYYAPDESENPVPGTQPFVHERQLLLPGTPAFPIEFQSVNATAFANELTILNGNTADDPSDYAVCNGDGSSKAYKTTKTLVTAGGACTAAATISQVRQALITGIPPVPAAPLDKVLSVGTLDATSLTPDPNTGISALTATATKKVNVFDLTLPSGLLRRTLQNVTLTLDGTGQSDPIFIIRRTTGNGLKFDGVSLKLQGVDPNNIFWVTRFGTVEIANNQPNQLAGNFIGSGPLIIRNGDQIKGGRFLGFKTTNIQGTFTALTTTAQPLVVPVVQLHSPTGQPGIPNTNRLDSAWLQRAKETTFNAVFVMGDSPARPLPNIGATAAESNGGLGNFPRFAEAWGDQTAAKISGGLIQFKRSGVATAPFETITNEKTDTALFFDTSWPTNLSNFPQDPSNFLYPGSASGNKAPYYTAPDRQWGYDVGLLSQTPDLFSRRFVAPQAGTPNEFFREVARDDKWVKTLLCGNTVDASGNPGAPALPAAQRPSTCPT